MKRSLYFIAGILVGTTLFGGTVAYAAGLTAERSSHKIFVDGKEVQIEAYNINGNNYCKLRDIGEAVGFNVFWDTKTNTVQVESQKPYTGIGPALEESSPEEEQPTEAADIDMDAVKQEVVDLTNALRKEKGASPLTGNEKLMEAAQVRAEEMAAAGVYSHTRPDGRNYTTVTDCPYVAENIHQIPLLYLKQQNQGLAETVVELWSNSAGHAKNMTDSRYGSIGVGIAKGVDSNGLECWYCVQLFLRSGYTVTSVDAPAA